MQATVGRKVHFYPGFGAGRDTSVSKLSDDQPIDATILYVWPKPESGPQLINLMEIDHTGVMQFKSSVPLIEVGQPVPESGSFAQWIEFVQPAPTAPVAAPIPASPAASAESPTTAPAVPTVESPSAGASAPAPEIKATVEVEHPVTYGFGTALQALKDGKAATRKGWNGAGMFVYLVPAASYKAQTAVAKAAFGEDAMVPYNAYFALKGVDGTVSTWVPSVRDCLAEDWEISQ